MCCADHTGANMRFVNRTPNRLSVVDRPRKWSMRKICSSGTRPVTVALSRRADSSSTPKGFSSASTVPSGIVTSASASHAAAATAGGTAK